MNVEIVDKNSKCEKLSFNQFYNFNNKTVKVVSTKSISYFRAKDILNVLDYSTHAINKYIQKNIQPERKKTLEDLYYYFNMLIVSSDINKNKEIYIDKKRFRIYFHEKH